MLGFTNEYTLRSLWMLNTHLKDRVRSREQGIH
jgi:hypothetical protein